MYAFSYQNALVWTLPNVRFCILDFGFAHPLGLMSGLVKSSQITFTSTLDASRNVRLFSTGLGWSAPDERLLKINFGRKMKITYIIFQNGGASGGLKLANFRILIGNDDVQYQVISTYGQGLAFYCTFFVFFELITGLYFNRLILLLTLINVLENCFVSV